MKLTNTKIYVSGNVIEVFNYAKILSYDYRNPATQRRGTDTLTEEEMQKKKTESRQRSMLRARSRFQRLVYANAGRWEIARGITYLPVFITFTFKENLTDIREANKIFTLFIKRMNFNIANSRTSKLKYLTVLEFQKRGAVHYHSIFFNLPAGVIEHERITRRIAKIWGNGFIDIESKLDIDGMAIYLTKYMIKGFEDTRLDGKKRYFDSRGLKNPVSILDRRMTDKLVANLSPQDMVYEKTFESEFMGTTTYRKYKVPEDHYALLNLKALARSIL